MQVPLAFWDGGRQYMVDNGPVPLTGVTDPGYPLQANAVWLYNPTTTSTTAGSATLGPGLSYVVAPTANVPTPIYGADFKDPNTGYANPNGLVMWYHETLDAHVFPDSLPAVITETSLRDPLQVAIAPDMKPDQIGLINNYDVSYVDTLGLPASMEATGAASNPPTPGSGQFAWTGADQSTTDMQQSVANFTTNNTSSSYTKRARHVF